ncbi:PH domain-containing protein DDB_G0287875-like [Coregonus clupeaformis]|uniref:PH domain-containing protein DDB_G0287875-like n=1 Tax=Coregonus clupeaformis TaxID=59861 RepID=UPI001E1C911C|nr:PH domain-containing protein DDB_G0287875-like [Coregonus clupeaformis]
MSLNITVKSEDSESFDEEDESSSLLSGKRGSESAARHDISPGEGGPIEDHAGYSTQHGRLATKTTSKPIVLYPVSADRFFSSTSADGKTILKIAPAPVMTRPTPQPPPQVSPEFSYQAIVYLIEAVGRRWSLYGTRERSQLFQSVQKELEEQGHCLPVEKIRRKWNNLIVTYKRVKYRGRETGQARTSWEYFEMMDAMLGDTIGAETTSSPTLVTSIPKVNVATETAKTEQKPLLLPHGNLITTCTRTLTLVPSSLPLHTPVPSTLPLYTFVRSLPPPTPVRSSLPLPTPLDTPSPRIANNTDPLQPNPSPAPAAQPAASCHIPSDLSRVHLSRKKRRRFSSSKGSSITSLLAQQQKRAEEGTSLLQVFLRRQAGQAKEEQVRRSRAEARGRRRERREARMAESLGRMATALELLSSKQDTVIALLQRLAERDRK